jgi:DNA-binding MarR family transcriptional regulator
MPDCVNLAPFGPCPDDKLLIGKRILATSPKKTSLSTQTGEPGEASYFKPGRSIGYLLRDCNRRFSKTLEAKIKPHGILVGQWFFLRELWQEDGLTQADLSTRVGMKAPTTVVAIRRLVEDGLVVREQDTQDRRKVRIYLTEKGRRSRDVLLPLAHDVNMSATEGFSKKEIRQFQSLFDRMKKNLT